MYKAQAKRNDFSLGFQKLIDLSECVLNVRLGIKARDFELLRGGAHKFGIVDKEGQDPVMIRMLNVEVRDALHFLGFVNICKVLQSIIGKNAVTELTTFDSEITRKMDSALSQMTENFGNDLFAATLIEQVKILSDMRKAIRTKDFESAMQHHTALSNFGNGRENGIFSEKISYLHPEINQELDNVFGVCQSIQMEKKVGDELLSNNIEAIEGKIGLEGVRWENLAHQCEHFEKLKKFLTSDANETLSVAIKVAEIRKLCTTTGTTEALWDDLLSCVKACPFINIFSDSDFEYKIVGNMNGPTSLVPVEINGVISLLKRHQDIVGISDVIQKAISFVSSVEEHDLVFEDVVNASKAQNRTSTTLSNLGIHTISLIKTCLNLLAQPIQEYCKSSNVIGDLNTMYSEVKTLIEAIDRYRLMEEEEIGSTIFSLFREEVMIIDETLHSLKTCLLNICHRLQTRRYMLQLISHIKALPFFLLSDSGDKFGITFAKLSVRAVVSNESTVGKIFALDKSDGTIASLDEFNKIIKLSKKHVDNPIQHGKANEEFIQKCRATASFLFALRSAIVNEEWISVDCRLAEYEHQSDGMIASLIKQEVDLSSQYTDQVQLAEDTVKALSSGYATGVAGAINTTSVRVVELERIVQKAKDDEHMGHLQGNVTFQKIISFCEDVLELRRAQLIDEISKVREISTKYCNTEDVSLYACAIDELRHAHLDSQVRILLEEAETLRLEGLPQGKTGRMEADSVQFTKLKAKCDELMSFVHQIKTTSISSAAVVDVIKNLSLLASLRETWKICYDTPSINTFKAAEAVMHKAREGYLLKNKLFSNEVHMLCEDITYRKTLFEFKISEEVGIIALSKFGSADAFQQSCKDIDSMAKNAVLYMDKEKMQLLLSKTKDLRIPTPREATMRKLLSLSEEDFLNLRLKVAMKMKDPDMIAECTVGIKLMFLRKAQEKDANVFSVEGYHYLKSAHHETKVGTEVHVYSKSVLSESLTCLPAAYDSLAVRLFKNVMGFMGDRIYSYPVECLEEVLRICVGIPELQDECFLQLMKQVRKNPNPKSNAKGWRMLLIILSYCLPSEPLENYLETFLHNRIKDGQDLAKRCLHQMHKTAYLGQCVRVPDMEHIKKTMAQLNLDSE